MATKRPRNTTYDGNHKNGRIKRQQIKAQEKKADPQLRKDDLVSRHQARSEKYSEMTSSIKASRSFPMGGEVEKTIKGQAKRGASNGKSPLVERTSRGPHPL